MSVIPLHSASLIWQQEGYSTLFIFYNCLTALVILALLPIKYNYYSIQSYIIGFDTYR